jgi:phosphoenolpyruvate carboxylase
LVELFQKEAHKVALKPHTKGQTLPVVPLFETAADLRASDEIMKCLYSLPWYKQHLSEVHGNRQQIMIGYSDSAKDAGRLTADWELYQAQERLVELAKLS